MTLTITIPNDTEGQRLIDDICAATNWDSSSGITKANWVKNKVIDIIRVYSKRGEFKTSQATISSQIDAIVIT